MTAPGTSRATRHNLGAAMRIPPGEGRTFAIGGGAVAVFLARDGTAFATQASCPHREGPLADGLVGDGIVICPLHAYRFRLRDGEPAGHDCGRLATYRVWLDAAGDVWVELPGDL